MAITIGLMFDDGIERVIGDYVNFDEAIEEAFTLADTHELARNAHGGSASCVHVRCGERIELSISIVRGGLAGPKAIHDQLPYRATGSLSSF